MFKKVVSARTAAKSCTKSRLLFRRPAMAAMLMLCAVLMSSCDNNKNGMIVIDPNTGKQYLLKHNVGDNYFIYERVPKIFGTDTTWVFDK